MGVKTSPACFGIEKSNIQVLNYPALLRLCWVLCVHAKSEWLSFCLKERKKEKKSRGGPVFRGRETEWWQRSAARGGGGGVTRGRDSPKSHFLSGIHMHPQTTSDCIRHTFTIDCSMMD